MSTEEQQAVEAHVAALNHGDLDALLDTFTDDAVFTSDGGAARGRGELAMLFDTSEDGTRTTTILRRVEQDGQHLDCVLTRRFTVTDDSGRVAAAHDIEVRAIFTVTDGAISRISVDPVT